MSSSVLGASAVFPVPRAEDSIVIPEWALGIIIAAVLVSLIWIVAIVVLVAIEICGPTSYRRRPQPQPQAPPHYPRQEKWGLGRKPSPSLATPPPPITASPPPSYSQSQQRDREDLSVVIPNLNPVETEKVEREMRLVMATGSACDSASVHSNSSAGSDDVVLSESVRTDASPGAESGGGASPQTDVSAAKSKPSNAMAGLILSRPVTIRQLNATLREPRYIETEFRKLPVVSVSSDELPYGTERKNRYTNVLPIPKTRVIISELFGQPNSSYINANFIRGHKGAVKQYIATQGPLESTVQDFWRMVTEHSVTVIVMVTNFQERNVDKCARYWPAQGSEVYGNVQVSLLQQTAHGTYNSTTLLVQPEGGMARTVQHYRLTAWPHQGLPSDTKVVTDFLMSIKMTDYEGPAVVHCSSGIGRTGVLLACDIGLQAILQGDQRIDFLRIVSTLRQDRPGMVQTGQQYRFIHQALYKFAAED